MNENKRMKKRNEERKNRRTNSCISQRGLVVLLFFRSVSPFVSSFKFLLSFFRSFYRSASAWARGLSYPVRLSTESSVCVMSGMIKKPSGPLRTNGWTHSNHCCLLLSNCLSISSSRWRWHRCTDDALFSSSKLHVMRPSAWVPSPPPVSRPSHPEPPSASAAAAAAACLSPAIIVADLASVAVRTTACLSGELSQSLVSRWDSRRD